MLYKLNNITRVHGERTVVNITDLEIKAKKIYTLIGPNGAGKTSLLKILAFLDQPTTGQIYFSNQPAVYKTKFLLELRRKIVLLDQSPIMFSGSVHANVEFGLRIRNIPKMERDKRIAEALQIVGMDHFSKYEAKSLSGGETKRVALARALVLRPEVLLCDEPTANVDNENQEIILEVLSSVNKEQSCSVIFSTHYLSQAQRLADHTLLLQHGALSDVVNENIYKVEVIGQEEEYLLCQLTGQLVLKLPKNLLPQGGGMVKLHIDPDLILLNPQEVSLEQGNVMAGHIVELSQDSGWVRIIVDVGVRLILRIALRQYLDSKPAIGDKAQVAIPHNSVTCNTIDY